jgi:hypothetical protein
LDFSGTAEGPARSKRLDTNDVATWKLSISSLREQGIADAEDLCAIVVIYVRRRWWRRQPGRDSKEFISDRIDVGMENVNKQAKRQFKNPTTSTPIRGRITIVPDESESSDDRDPASEGELPPVR